MKIFTFFITYSVFCRDLCSRSPKHSRRSNCICNGPRKKEKDIAQSFVVARSDDINFVSASHPSQYLNRMSGVYVNNLGGEGI